MGKERCNCKFFHGTWEDKNVFWEVTGSLIFMSAGKGPCFGKTQYERDESEGYVEI